MGGTGPPPRRTSAHAPGTELGSCQITDGSCRVELTFATAGQHSVSITYDGDDTFAPFTDATTLTVS